MCFNKEKVKYYNRTLHLPKTAFSMKANLGKVEENILTYWSTIDLYNLIKSKRETQPSFILNDGPPYANGSIHIGHGLNKVLKDITNKVAIFFGKRILYVPGWDCHGLPIELAVEKKLGKPITKEEKQSFRQNCRKYAEEQIKIQRKEFIRLGVLGDWDNFYSTMHFSFEANVLRVLKILFENDFLVKYNRPVYWCFDCKSSLADAEVLYINKISTSLFVNFFLIEHEIFLQKFNLTHLNFYKISFVVWTTTPWTLLFNEVVALNDSFNYSMFITNEDNNLYVVSSVLLSTFLQSTGKQKIKILFETSGYSLLEFSLLSPYRDKKISIVSSEHVKNNSGTGFVHIAPAYGYDDFLVSKIYDLPCLTEINAEGFYIGANLEHKNKNVYELDVFILKYLCAHDFIFFSSNIEHSYPHCWRHKTSTIYRATSQWFIDLKKHNLLEKSLQLIDNVDCSIPKWSKQSFVNILKNRPDWCISRQRLWGVPIPLFTHNKTGNVHPKTVEILEKSIDIVAKFGVEGWYAFSNTLSKENEFFEYTNTDDVLDVWFDSSVVHYCVLDNIFFGLKSPSDLCIEGVDQYRGWFQASLLTSVALKNNVPFKKIITHGFVLDNHGVKLSKSSKNKISPDTVINTYGADIFRLWVSSVDFTVDVMLSEEILERLCDSYRKIRNTIRFIVANLVDFSFVFERVLTEKLIFIDFWMLSEVFNLQKSVLNNYKTFNYNAVYKELKIFCINTLSSFYFDVLKDRLYTTGKKSFARRSAQTVLYFILNVLLQLMAPILSFTSEEIWLYMVKNLEVEFKVDSVFLQTWYINPIEDVVINIHKNFWYYFLPVRLFVIKLLSYFIYKKFIRTTLDSEIFLYCGIQLYEMFKFFVAELHFSLLVSRVHLFNFEETGILTNVFNTNKSSVLFFVKIQRVKHFKCLRCWQRVLCVSMLNEQRVCNRCVRNINEPNLGEVRLFF